MQIDASIDDAQSTSRSSDAALQPKPQVRTCYEWFVCSDSYLLIYQQLSAAQVLGVAPILIMFTCVGICHGRITREYA